MLSVQYSKRALQKAKTDDPTSGRGLFCVPENNQAEECLRRQDQKRD